MQNITTTIYEVRNKVFSMLFWREEDAQEFLNHGSATSGLRISPILVFGELPDGIQKAHKANSNVVAKQDD